MKKIILSLLCFLMTAANAGELHPFGFDFDVEGYYYRYREQNKDHSTFMKEAGPVIGINAGVEWVPSVDGFKARLETRLARTFFVRYTAPESGTMHGSRHWVSETRVLGAYPFYCSDLWVGDGYVGYGFRYLDNDDRGRVTSRGAAAYLRTSRYNYLPIGIQVTQFLECNRLLTWFAEYDYFINGKQKSYLSRFGLMTCNNRQKKGLGARLGLDYSIPDQDDEFHYYVGAFVRYWHIHNSKLKFYHDRWGSGYVYEPQNKTHEVGIHLGVHF